MKKQTAMSCLALLVAASGLAAKPGGTSTRELTYAGLPAITYVSDSDGLLSEVRMGGKQIASYDWSKEPYAVSVRFFSRWVIDTSVMPDGSGTQRVIDPAGKQNGSSVILAHARQLGRPTMLLDTLAADLGLAPGWEDGQQVTSTNDVQLRANGKTLNIKFHSVGQGIRVGESEGKAVLWDLDLPLGLKGLLGQIVPSRLIVTSSGSVHLAPDNRLLGAFDGIWTNDSSGGRITLRKQLDTSAAQATSKAASHVTMTDATVSDTDAIPAGDAESHAEMMWICGMTEYWVSATDGLNWWYETRYRPTYCDSGDGGGVGGCSVSGLQPRAMSDRPVGVLTICDGDGSGGGPGGGTGTGSNNQIADPTLHAAVDDGKGNATAKLQSAQCQQMIRMNTNAAGISLWTVLTSYSPDPGTYIDSQITFVKGDGAIDIGTGFVPCNDGRLAWTRPGVHTTDICGTFKNLSTGMRGVTLIHEMLHSLGLPEYPNGYTSEDIQKMVVDWCGGQ